MRLCVREKTLSSTEELDLPDTSAHIKCGNTNKPTHTFRHERVHCVTGILSWEKKKKIITATFYWPSNHSGGGAGLIPHRPNIANHMHKYGMTTVQLSKRSCYCWSRTPISQFAHPQYLSSLPIFQWKRHGSQTCHKEVSCLKSLKLSVCFKQKKHITKTKSHQNHRGCHHRMVY